MSQSILFFILLQLTLHFISAPLTDAFEGMAWLGMFTFFFAYGHRGYLMDSPKAVFGRMVLAYFAGLVLLVLFSVSTRFFL